jgi:hypothetical protein
MTLSSMICKAFLTRCPSKEQSALYSLLPEKERREMEKLPAATLREGVGKNPLHWIHFSWFAPFLRTLTQRDLSLFLGGLSKQQSTGLKELLRFSEPLPAPTSFFKEFVHTILFSELNKEQELIPPSYLPTSVFDPLLQLRDKQLMTVIRYLGLYDLSFEMRQMIATAHLKKILRALHREEVYFTREIADQRDPLIFKRFFLQGWDGKRSSLVSLLHERGLQRLALGISSQGAGFTWSLAHVLELGVATRLLALSKSPKEERVSQILSAQILTVLERICKE